MARYTKIRRPISTISGDESAIDGSELLNMYASASVDPTRTTVPFILKPTAGLSGGFNVSHGDSSATQSSELRMIAAVDSPYYGDHLFVMSERKMTIFSAYAYSTDTATKYYEVATPANFRAPADKPIRWATDGRRIVLISASEVWAFDRKVANSNAALSNPSSGPSPWVTVTAPQGDDDSDTTRTEDWVDVIWADGYFVLANQGGQIWNSELNSLTFDQLDFALADTKWDGIVAMAFFGAHIYVFGTASIERWYNAGLTTFAFARDASYSWDVGIWKRETLQVTESGIFFIGSDLVVYHLTPVETAPGTNIVEEEIKAAVRLDSTENGVGLSFSHTEEGHRFYGIRTGIKKSGSTDQVRKYWVYDLKMGAWHIRDCGEAWIIATAVWKDEVFAITGNSDSKNRVRRMSRDEVKSIAAVATNDLRQMTLPVVYLDLHKMKMYSFDIDVEYDGTETLKIGLSWSDDNRKTYKGYISTEANPTRQITYDKDKRVRFNQLGSISWKGRSIRLDFGRTAATRFGVLGCYGVVDALRQ